MLKTECSSLLNLTTMPGRSWVAEIMWGSELRGPAGSACRFEIISLAAFGMHSLCVSLRLGAKTPANACFVNGRARRQGRCDLRH